MRVGSGRRRAVRRRAGGHAGGRGHVRQALDRLGAKYGLPEVWIGLLTALAADGPEVSSALVALIKGAHDASVGVIVGSNTFNLAAMIGVSALLVGCVQVARNTLLLEGSVALAVTVIVIALLVGWISAVPAVLAIAVRRGRLPAACARR